ncbi:MAG: hypothetical protein FWB96_07310 [Defluviitaleaceae bacterium]|nr:hypothetical protein [Defluviitaleaceae bacterium]MCL2262448.1 hypothetical protein [Defluviitaleaceae bacterium]
MQPFDLFITHLSWGEDGKCRPVLVYVIDGDEVGIFQITTQYGSKSEHIRAKYFEIKDWAEAGLDRLSYVDTGTLIDIPVAQLSGKTPIGKLTETDKQRFLDFLPY